MDEQTNFDRVSAHDVIARARNSEPLAMSLSDQNDGIEENVWMDAALASLPASALFDPEVLAAVELLMDDSESVTAQTRQRLVDGADRGVRWLHRRTRHIGHLLRDSRCAGQQTPGEIAAHLGTTAACVTEVESGARPIQSLSALQVAAWIRCVGLAPDAALASLQCNEGPGHASAAEAASQGVTFTCAVANALGWSPGRR